MIDREVSYVVTATTELTSNLGKTPVKAREIAVLLDGVVQKLQQLKRKVFSNLRPMKIVIMFLTKNPCEC